MIACSTRISVILALLAIHGVQDSFAQSLTEQLKREGVRALAAAARKHGDAIRGSVLLPQEKLGCANCHLTGNRQLLGPDLNQLSKQTTDESLVQSLLEPSRDIKKGFETTNILTTAGRSLTGRVIEQSPRHVLLRTIDAKKPTSGGTLVKLPRDEIEAMRQSRVSAMPGNLPDLLANRQEFLDLSRYLMELADRNTSVQKNPYSLMEGKPLDDVSRGFVLIDRFRCELCHGSIQKQGKFHLNHAPNLKVSLTQIYPSYVEQFLKNPAGTKPGTSMPHMLARLPEAERANAAKSLTHYLYSLTESRIVDFQLESMNAERGRVLFYSVGCVACHAPRDQQGREKALASSTPLGNLQKKFTATGLITFLKDPHVARPGGRMPGLNLDHYEAQDIAAYLLKINHEKNALSKPLDLDPKLIAAGKKHFHEFQCHQCHRLQDQAVLKAMTPFARMTPHKGCLSTLAGSWPAYQLTDTQRKDLQAAIGQVDQRFKTMEQQLSHRLATLNCLACHQRDGWGGVRNDREEYFQTTNLNLGPQGRIPPALTGVGAKLTPQALRDVLINGHSVRPYMLTRMPAFGKANTQPLIQLFMESDSLPATAFGELADQKASREAGWQLAGSSGLNCIACHTFQQKPAKTMPAIDLTVMGGRLQKRWFSYYLKSPQRFHPGTVMPSFWNQGQSLRKEILEGDADLQIAALWTYLQDGRQARTPRGLVVKPIELLATDEAVMLRRSYPGIGKRGIGVGYPSGVNLAFDAEQMRLAMIWKGKFADPGGVWRGQGHGTVRPLGEKILSFTDGPELTDLHAAKATQARPPHHQFGGYSLDRLRRPTFHYRYRQLSIDDFFRGIESRNAVAPGLLREITFHKNLASRDIQFRAASGRSIQVVDEQTFKIDNQLEIRILTSQSGKVTKSAGGQQLLIPVSVPQSGAQLLLEYRW